MTVVTTLANVKTVLDGVIADTYIWPTDYATMAAVPALPMLIIEEAINTPQQFIAMAMAGPTRHEWNMKITGFVTLDNLPTIWPSPELARVEALVGTLMSDTYNRLKSNVNALGVLTFGDATSNTQPLFWNTNKADGTKAKMVPCWGFEMLIPFVEETE